VARSHYHKTFWYTQEAYGTQWQIRMAPIRVLWIEYGDTMQRKNSRAEFFALFTFLVALTLLLTNGFAPRIHAQGGEVDLYPKIEPIGEVLSKILDEYVEQADMDRVVEGAIFGMMGALGGHNSYIPVQALTEIREDTRGEFEGIGVSIRETDKRVVVHMPIEGAPAAKAGLRAGDFIVAVDDTTIESLWEGSDDNPAFKIVNAVADRIRGQRGTSVKITVSREDGGIRQNLDFMVKRAKVPLESIKEARILPGGIGYIRIRDFKDNTAKDMKKRLNEFKKNGMKAFVLDLRWNPGGLLSASQEVCDLFLPKKSLVTYTKGRARADGSENPENMELFTDHTPVLPLEFPMIVLVNKDTASSAEIVTGALQFHRRALILGEKTFGKGSVQTIIPLKRPKDTALRLTTALYYTPADVTIDHQGIFPDVSVPMSDADVSALINQMFRSHETDHTKQNAQNHGTASGNEVSAPDPADIEREEALLKQVAAFYGQDVADILRERASLKEKEEKTVDDLPLLRAVNIIKEGNDWEATLEKYHRDVSETQMAASASAKEAETADVP
jgi:carboxyl-terminal processing protease